MAVTHTMVSVIDDGADSSLVQPSDWNANHSIETVLPDADSTHDLGSGSYRWQHAYVEGVAFPATQVASADANILDDYEEGDYTPVGNVITFSAASGRYTKIGRLVAVQFDVTFPSSSDTNQARISLPLTCGSVGAATWVVGSGSSASDDYWYVLSGTAYLMTSITGSGGLTNGNCTTGRYLGVITYSV